jgi:hypothetical protein
MVMGTDQLQYPYQLYHVRDFLKKVKGNAIATRRCYTCVRDQRGFNTKRPTIVFFSGPTKPLIFINGCMTILILLF